ncbi:SNF2-related protein [Eubacterium sp.]|uniref:SNF2-related protein n=1 Tax=Eubacterium sp. TaxID=142586 RepID=UPI0025CCB34A|nr:SNF2-related protein [Eubacterium sp.]MCR5630099.1 DEAD/DEAH box helicase family protein [Eubacterium sp.]
MQDSYMIGKMNTYMHQLAEQMSDWLGIRLPKITDDWWQDLVYNNLSLLQREQVDLKNITDLKGLDLAALLRVFDRNWFVITSSCFINFKERQNIKEMMVVRNSWAHITSEELSKEKVIHDVQVIIELMQTCDAEMNATRDMEEFILDVESDKEIHNESFIILNQFDSSDSNESTESKEKTSEIDIGSIVTLASDSSKVGAVISVNEGKYTVWMDNAPQTFYKEQIKLKEQDIINTNIALSRVKSALTAYQINNPSSSDLYSLNSARIDFVPYQFRPALKIIKSDSPRLLVADDVGVGKTIEAGLVLKEMEARSSVESVLIICPRPLVAERKWELEMKRFDEDFTQLDGKELLACITEMDRDGEWPERHKKTIIPYSLFGEDMLAGTESRSDKKNKRKGLLQLDPLPHFDLVIVDEAHNIRNSNTWAYQGVELFTRSADAVVFLTATPLQNSNNDLYTLLNLLRPDVVIDKDTFQTMSEPNAFVNGLLRIVRNQDEGWQEIAKDQLSEILKTTWGRNVIQHNPNFEKVYELINKGYLSREEKVEAISLIESLHSFNGMITRTRRRDIEDFCIRHTQTIKVPFTDEQQNLYDALMEFEEKVLTQMHGGRSVRFMMCTIMRQAASCIYGLAPFVKDIVKKKLNQIQEDGELFEFEIDLNTDLENSIFELADELEAFSIDLPAEDSKLNKLFEVINQKQKEDNNRVILFSSFRHTLRYIKDNLQSKGYRVEQVDGSVSDEERYKIRERFLMNRDEEEAIDVLLFSEVGCEGLDYQFCDTMINYDLPWNPMRIEQRIGRIDRRGQKSESVRIYNMITEGTIDAVIHDRCLSKIGVFEESIGDCSEILGDISEQIFKIMLLPGLSDEERQMKIEKMADNEVLKVQEMNRLEQEEKSLYGFDLSNYIQNKEVQDAESNWVSPENISNLVDSFLNNYLGEGDYIRTNKNNELRTMRIGGDKKQKLIDSMNMLNNINMNNATKLWKAYLKSTTSQLRITYDSTTAKDNRDVTFLTQMHPLVLQAAKYESELLPCEIGICVSDDSIPAGDYEFLIYAWKYVGLRPDIKLVAISDDERVEENVLSYMQYASDYKFNNNEFRSKWDDMDKIHYKNWQNAKDVYVDLVREDCNYREEQLRQMTNKRESIIKSQIENVSDEKILRMRNAQLDNLKKQYSNQKRNFEETVQKADIHTQQLIKGVLHVL